MSLLRSKFVMLSCSVASFSGSSGNYEEEFTRCTVARRQPNNLQPKGSKMSRVNGVAVFIPAGRDMFDYSVLQVNIVNNHKVNNLELFYILI